MNFVFRFFGVIFSYLTMAFFLAALFLVGIFYSYNQDLPSTEQLIGYAPATVSKVYSVEGEVIDEFAYERRMFTPVDEIPEVIKNAFISAEDKNFYKHSGYDAVGMAKAVVTAAQGGRLRGASTISQQVAKNLFLSGERTGRRKVKEIILATRIEKTLPKDKVLEIYLNEIFLGQNSYGVTAAAQTYFGKPLEALTVEEAAYLAVLPKAPSKYHPVKQAEDAIERRNFVLKEMNENGYITNAQRVFAKNEPLRSVQSGFYESVREQRRTRSYFTDEIRRQLTQSMGEEELFAGGLNVRATVNDKLQKQAEYALRRALEGYDRGRGVYWGATANVADQDISTEAAWRKVLANTKIPRDVKGWFPAVVLKVGKNSARIGIEDTPEDEDGHFIPMADMTWASPLLENGERGKRARKPADLLKVGDVIHVRAVTKGGKFLRWSLRQIPKVQGAFVAMDTNTGRVLAMQGGFSYQHSVFNRATQAMRQPGSAFKPFVYASALDNGYSPVTLIEDAPIAVRTPQGMWRPKNASHRYYGLTPLRTGIERSRNLMTIRLAKDVGMNIVADYAERFGVYDNMMPVLANALGSQETTVYKMVTAYAMFANGGIQIEPTLVDRVQNRWGETVYRHDQRECLDCQSPTMTEDAAPQINNKRRRIMDEVTAYQLTSMMQGVIKRGTARKSVNLGVPVAGKTGTTNDAKDVWFVGYTRNIVAGCYIGYDKPRSLGRGASGGGMCGPVFQRFMKLAIAEYGAPRFRKPKDAVFIKIDIRTGARVPDDATGEFIISEVFRKSEIPEFGQIASAIDGGYESAKGYERITNYLDITTEKAAGTIGQNLEPKDKKAVAQSKPKVVKKGNGKQVKIGGKSNLGTITSGGVY